MNSSPELKGFCLPLSPEGKAQLVGPPPWHFSMDLMAFNFKADPEEVKKYLPLPYELSSEPDMAYVWFRMYSQYGKMTRT